MVNELHLAIDRKPISMNIQRTHEDADHEAFIVEILVLLSFLDDHNLTIGRCHHKFLGVTIVIADRATVEIECHHPGCTKNEDKSPKRYRRLDEKPKHTAYSKDGQHAQRKFVGALTMDTNFLQFFYPCSHEMSYFCLQRYKIILNSLFIIHNFFGYFGFLP